MKLILSLLLIVLAFTGIAQVKIINHSLTDDSLSILYRGIENEIEITGYSWKPKSTVAINGGSFQNLSPNKYLVTVGYDSMATIAIKEKSKVIFSRNFIIDTIPDPVARVGGITDSVATLQQVLLSGMLRIDYPNSHFRHSARIKSFDLTIFNGTDFIDIASPSYIFSPEMINAMKGLVPGNRLLFDNVRMDYPGGRTRRLPSFQIRII